MKRLYYFSYSRITYQEGYTTGIIFRTYHDPQCCPILFYCENDYFYEFFTKKLLGKFNSNSGYLFSDELGGNIPFHVIDSLSVVNPPTEVSEAEFATKAKELMPYKQKICAELEKKFSEWRKNHEVALKRQAEANSVSEIKARESSRNVNWLHDLLDGK